MVGHDPPDNPVTSYFATQLGNDNITYASFLPLYLATMLDASAIPDVTNVYLL